MDNLQERIAVDVEMIKKSVKATEDKTGRLLMR